MVNVPIKRRKGYARLSMEASFKSSAYYAGWCAASKAQHPDPTLSMTLQQKEEYMQGFNEERKARHGC